MLFWPVDGAAAGTRGDLKCLSLENFEAEQPIVWGTPFGRTSQPRRCFRPMVWGLGMCWLAQASLGAFSFMWLVLRGRKRKKLSRAEKHRQGGQCTPICLSAH